MAEIEYGSYYRCVVINGKDGDAAGESVHLHADSVGIDPAGALLFKDRWQAQAWTEPIQNADKKDEKSSKKSSKEFRKRRR